MLVFRTDRLVTGHLDEAPLAHERFRHWPPVLSGRSLRQHGIADQAWRPIMLGAHSCGLASTR
jgi:hypothetical protein